MLRIQRPSLLNFLQKPRYVKEVAQEFGISSDLAKYHLKEAVKSGHVLVIKDRFPLTGFGKGLMTNSRDDLLRISGQAFSRREVSSASRLRGSRVRFLANNVNLAGLKLMKGGKRVLPLGGLHRRRLTLSSRSHSSKIHKAGDLRKERPSYGGKRPTQLTLSSLFKELESEALTLPEITQKFKVSKHSVKRLVKTGILREDWGLGGVGVRYKLSKKGERRFSAIKKASQLTSRREAFISLESRLNV